MRKGRILARAAERILPKAEASMVIKGMDVVGDIAVLKIPRGLEGKESALAKALLEEAPSLKVVFKQTRPVEGDYRLRGLEWLAGEKRSTTAHKEHGCSFKVDIKKVFFSPRLSFERARVAELVKNKPADPRRETIINFFAGVGCFSILIAKARENVKVFSIDLNPDAILFMMENIIVNKVRGRVTAVLSEARRIVKELFVNKADRVLMPLPEKAYEFLDAALMALKPKGGYVHYQGFARGVPEGRALEEVKEKVSGKLERLGADFEVEGGRIVRSIGPYEYHVALDLRILPKKR
ncbi:TPA: class I SAM-dependent methyltransferase family protein [Candidatus Bathyarchaeota archaeon]|nr:class I SAM-dependent methyltransferase family protein [Candidatus Bathyarchaeota archaeon]